MGIINFILSFPDGEQNNSNENVSVLKAKPVIAKELETPKPKEDPIEPRQEPLHIFQGTRTHTSTFSLSSRRPAGDHLHTGGNSSPEQEIILVEMNQRHSSNRRDPHNSSPPTRLVLGKLTSLLYFYY